MMNLTGSHGSLSSKMMTMVSVQFNSIPYCEPSRNLNPKRISNGGLTVLTGVSPML